MLITQEAFQIYKILGVVAHVSINGSGNIFTVICSNSRMEYKIKCPFFCPARRGDIIAGYYIRENDGRFTFANEPVVEPPFSKEEVQSMFAIALRGTHFNRELSDNLYNFFKQEALNRINESKANSADPVVKNKDMLPSATIEMISVYAQKYRLDNTTLEPLEQIGLSTVQGQKLLNWWYKSFTLRRLYLLGLTKKEIRESYERGWNADSLYYQLLENPYIIEKISMEKAQSIANRYNLSFGKTMIDSAYLVRFIDEQTINKGWTCYPIYALMRKCPQINELFPILKKSFKCSIRYNFLYMKHQAEVEDKLANYLQPKKLPETYCCDSTKKFLIEEQINAVEVALNNTVSVITGGAGTGKTVTISAIADELELRNEGYIIASFTGKAVARIKEVVHGKKNVQTLHMILSRNIPEISKLKCLIIDETSMVPNELLARVIDKLIEGKDDFRIVLVGDPNQVQPIECGDLFNQLFIAQTLPISCLTTNHRIKTKSILHSNIQKFSTEIPDEICIQWGSDCQFIEGGIPEIESLVKILHSYNIPHSEITIISPFNRDLEGINKLCQDIFLNDDNPKIMDSFGKEWKLGARVMMTTNRYDIDVMNGEEGIIVGIKENTVIVRFRGGEINIPTFIPIQFNDVGDIEESLSTKLLILSWAITVHKSQGSEWRFVIFYLPPNNSQSGFLNRKLLYTGMSRAKEALYVISSSEHAFLSSISVEPSRYDNLGKRLQGEEYFDSYVNPMYMKNMSIPTN